MSNRDKYKRTVREARKLLSKPAIKARSWSLLRRKLTFGRTKASVQRNLISMTFCGRKVTVNRKVVASLHRVEKRIRAAEHKHGWDAWKPERIDCFNWRVIRGGTVLSRHAHGIAVDIDPGDNKSTAHFDKKDTTTVPVRVIQAFMDEGWTAGVNWNEPNDPMHFQYC